MRGPRRSLRPFTVVSRRATVANPSATEVPARVNAIDWARVSVDLDAQGSARIERLISPGECEALASLYPIDALFRSRVVMARHGFGRGEYKYFSYPLPSIVEGIRSARYPRLVP